MKAKIGKHKRDNTIDCPCMNPQWKNENCIASLIADCVPAL